MSTKTILHKLNRKDIRIFPSINTITKIVFVALIAITITFFTKSILAQSTFKDKQDAMSKGNNQEAWLSEAMSSNIVSTTVLLGGTIPFDSQGNITAYTPSGALGSTTKMISSLYKPSASGIEYIAQVKNNFLGKPAYAQNNGIGFAGLNPILPIWKSFRNVIYVISALIFVIIGIMIMLRVKVSAQAVVTIQSAIPGIITTLILVTFSYAIAGLLIDFSYYFQAFVLAILFNSKNGLNSPLFDNGFLSYNPGFSDLSTANLGTIYGLMLKATPKGAIFRMATIPTTLIGSVIGSVLAFPIGTIIGGLGGFVLGAIGGVLIFLIVMIMLFIWLVKFFFGLLKCYIVVILKIILAPLEIGMGAFPNSKLGFSSWLTDLIANLAVFPISLLFLVMANMIIEATDKGLWQPNLIGGSLLGAAANFTTGGILPTALGIATVMMLSKLPKMIPEFIFSIKPSPWGKALGESFKNMPLSGTAQFGARAGGEAIAGKIRANNVPGGPGWAKAGGYAVKAAESMRLIRPLI